ncbi:MAG: hypothetical protein EWV40_08110 [Microcystis flos-aquae Mf_WU_F_19750830_S460]|uniref:Uncharacterized protein n=1 Tax=Microcystis flos-aquae Mf_WU_F_19750830_S460 TaxID=2486237 RepID=A0A552LTF3_9CHRO|nr:MAG: hypothetical protein EWV40_08110 [Microcystis flos-aquae Mf_WU_F_19750830_S460]
MNSYPLFSYQEAKGKRQKSKGRSQKAEGSFILPTPHTPHPTPHTPHPTPHFPNPQTLSPISLTNDCPTFNRFSGICPRFLCRFRGDQ